MGKLSKLRREIEKDPEKWFFSNPKFGIFNVYGAWYSRCAGKWTPMYSLSYKKFVTSVLKRLGYIKNGG